VAETGKKAFPDEAMLDKGKAAGDLSDTMGTKGGGFGHGFPPLCIKVMRQERKVYRVLLCKIG
jgi:hypothetical protein